MKKPLLVSLLCITPLGACTAVSEDNVEPVPSISKLAETSAITGSLTYRERIALTPGSIATVSLEDMSRADAPAILIDQKRYSVNGVPFGFELRLPNRDMPQAARYTVRAKIRDANGKLLFTTDTVNPVMRRPVDQELGEIVMVRAAS